jgi:hypothetical protein
MFVDYVYGKPMMCAISIHYLIIIFPDFKVFFSLSNFWNSWVVNDDFFIDF